MKAQTGESYQSSVFGKEMVIGEAKMGKTVAEVASILGAFPWQKDGGIVDVPEALTVITFDANALGHIQKFLVETCGARKEALKFRVLNMQSDYAQIHRSKDDYDPSFYTQIFDCIDNHAQYTSKFKSPVLLFSSLTGAASGILRGLQGPIKSYQDREGNERMNKSTMDQNKWAMYAMQLNEMRNAAQQDSWHTVWEAHLNKTSGGRDESGERVEKDTLSIMGKEGVNWPYNVEHVYRLRRKYGQRYQNTKLDQVVFEARPSLDFIAGGRGFTEFLDREETDLAAVFRKLGMRVGGFKGRAGAVQVQVPGAVKATVKTVTKAVKPVAQQEVE